MLLGSNQLEEISSDIFKLHNLEELSIAGNQLRYLPAEIALLPRLKSISINQNPFMSDKEIEAFNDESSSENALDLKEICIRILALYSPQILKERGVQISRCSNCHRQVGTPFRVFIRKQSICNSNPVPVMYKSCSLRCHNSFPTV